MDQIVVYQNEKRTIEITITDDSGAPFDLTGWDVQIRLKSGPNVVTKDLTDGLTVPTPSEGVVEMELTAVDTAEHGPYSAEMRISDADTDVVVLKTTVNIAPSLFT